MPEKLTAFEKNHDNARAIVTGSAAGAVFLVLVEVKIDKLPQMTTSMIWILIAVQAATNSTPAAALPPAPQVLPIPAPAAPPPPPAPLTPYGPVPPKPKGNPGTWVKNSDYPKELRGGESGTTRFRLHVNDKGKPIACDIVGSSGHPKLDARTCEIMMKRAKFVPARSGFNKPTYGTFTSRVMWAAPK